MEVNGMERNELEWKLMECDRIAKNVLRRNGMKGAECE